VGTRIRSQRPPEESEDDMRNIPALREIYGVSDRRTQQRVMAALRRKRNLTATADLHEGNRVVVVECPESRAQWVFRKITAIDPRALLLFATTATG
jgi:hypothetical protein